MVLVAVAVAEVASMVPAYLTAGGVVALCSVGVVAFGAASVGAIALTTLAVGAQAVQEIDAPADKKDAGPQDPEHFSLATPRGAAEEVEGGGDETVQLYAQDFT